MIRYLLLHRIEWTNERPWFGFAGMTVTGLIFSYLKWRFL